MNGSEISWRNDALVIVGTSLERPAPASLYFLANGPPSSRSLRKGCDSLMESDSTLPPYPARLRKLTIGRAIQTGAESGGDFSRRCFSSIRERTTPRKISSPIAARVWGLEQQMVAVTRIWPITERPYPDLQLLSAGGAQKASCKQIIAVLRKTTLEDMRTWAIGGGGAGGSRALFA